MVNFIIVSCAILASKCNSQQISRNIGHIYALSHCLWMILSIYNWVPFATYDAKYIQNWEYTTLCLLTSALAFNSDWRHSIWMSIVFTVVVYFHRSKLNELSDLTISVPEEVYRTLLIGMVVTIIVYRFQLHLTLMAT